ncbi:hypothetical protein EB796_018406 [Bugula neritina]|uniref:Uncharacterized protein n=1 Tax=Bugula neritina TaxID=10212 RepID=A0A7J7JAL2_BUGNE|nr:hypothetical protein EB796_018406 [Bugula neritina]
MKILSVVVIVSIVISALVPTKGALTGKQFCKNLCESNNITYYSFDGKECICIAITRYYYGSDSSSSS